MLGFPHSHRRPLLSVGNHEFLDSPFAKDASAVAVVVHSAVLSTADAVACELWDEPSVAAAKVVLAFPSVVDPVKWPAFSTACECDTQRQKNGHPPYQPSALQS